MHITDACEIIKTIAILVGGGWAVRTYHQGYLLQRAQWAYKFYSAYYDATDKAYLRKIREALDCYKTDVTAKQEVTNLVRNQDTALTDYLNFFEMLAYLCATRQLEKEDVYALFDYYLKCLYRHTDVEAYIFSEANGYEYLKSLLSEHKQL